MATTQHPGFGDASRAGFHPYGPIAHWPDAKIGPGALQRAKGTSEGRGWGFCYVLDGQKLDLTFKCWEWMHMKGA